LNFCARIMQRLSPRKHRVGWVEVEASRRFSASVLARPILLGCAFLALDACSAMRTTPKTPPTTPPLESSAPAEPIAATTPAPAADAHPPERDKKRPKPIAPKEPALEALAPTEVGYYVDVLQGRLKQVSGTRMGIDRADQRIFVSIPIDGDVSADEATLSPAVRNLLTPICMVLTEYRMTTISVHVASQDPPAAGATPLAPARTVAHFLTASGVSSRRVVIAAPSGERTPSTSSTEADQTRESRTRIELTLDPIVRSPPSR
jgi:hypothetical protein